MASDFLHGAHIINGLYPKADAFVTSATTDYVSMSSYRRIGFLIHTGDATSGTANGTVTVLGATTAAGAGATAVAFSYRTCASSTTVDTWSAQTAAAAAGFSMTAADNYLYWVEVNVEDVAAAVDGADFVALKVLEVTNDPIVAGMIIFGLDPRYPGDLPVSAIA